MDQFKLSVDEILYSDLTDAQILAIVRLKALTAQLEQNPTEKQIKRIISAKSIKNLSNIDPKLIELETNSVLTQVELVIKKRGYSKTKMRQVREKPQDVTGNKEECYRSIKEIKRKEIKKDTIVSPKVCDVDFDYIFNVWKELVGLCPNIKPITKLTDSRKKKLLKRFSENRENFQEMYKKSLQNIVDSDYLQGSKGWIITFDWLIHSETNFTKVYEGNYNNGGTSKANDRAAMLAEVDRLGEQERLIREYSRRKLQTGTV